MTRRSRFSPPRRDFMRQAAAVGAAMAATPAPAAAQAPAPAAAASTASDAEPEALTGGRAGSDFMVDTIKALGFEYVCINPDRASAACTNRSSTTATTASRS
jgi:hypothetical protein